MVGDKAEALRRDGHALDEIAILVRTSARPGRSRSGC